MQISLVYRSWLVTATVVLVAIVVTPRALNAFEPVKLMVVVTGATAALATTWLAGGFTADRMRPLRWPLAAAGAFVVVMTLSAVIASPGVMGSIIGVRTRWGGLALYLACAGLFTVCATLPRRGIRRVMVGIALAGGLIAIVATLQSLGAPILDGIGNQDGSPSTLGNINFSTAFVGASAGAMAWIALDPSFDKVLRIGGVVLFALSLVNVAFSLSFQGIPTLGTAALVVVVHHVWVTGGTWKKFGLPVLGVTALVGGALVIAGVLGTGPLSRLSEEKGVQLREGYWSSAANMMVDNPILGIGPGQYAYEFRQYRSFDDAANLELLLDNDAAHNIFLHHGASGGLLLLGAFLLLLTAVAVRVIKGFMAPDTDRRLLAGALAVLAGYLVQGMVSIDVSALAALGWISMGLVVAASHATLPAPSKRRAKKGRALANAHASRKPGWPRQAVAGAAILAVALGTAQPLRAETAALTSRRQTTNEARAEMSGKAADIGVWDPRYKEGYGLALLTAEDLTGLKVADSLYRDNELTASSTIQIARLLVDRAPDAAGEWYRRALELEPQHPELRLEAAEFFADHGDTAEAEAVATALADDDPENADVRTLLAELGP